MSGDVETKGAKTYGFKHGKGIILLHESVK